MLPRAHESTGPLLTTAPSTPPRRTGARPPGESFFRVAHDRARARGGAAAAGVLDLVVEC